MNIGLAKNRHESYLPSLSNREYTKTYLVFDVESDLVKIGKNEHEHRPKLICAKIISFHSDSSFVESEGYYFNTVEEFHNFVEEVINKYYSFYIVAHNTSYDITVSRLFDLFDKMGLKCGIFNPRRGSYYMTFVNKKFRIQVIDSLNWFKSTLEKLGKEIGKPKMKYNPKSTSQKYWLKYCMNDVDIVIEAMKQLSKYLSHFGLGDLRITIGSTAFSIFRKNFHNTNLFHTNNLTVLNLEYDSYFGGRTEMFRHGKLEKQDYFYYDFNSLYPSVMSGNLFSTKIRGHFKDSSIDQLKNYIRNYGCIAKVQITTDKPYYPKRIKKFTAFPVGVFDTTLATPELKMALEFGHITKVYCLSVYQQKEIFTDYIKFFHKSKTDNRKKGKDIFAYFDKLMLNTLYGKFGQKIPNLIEQKGYQKEKYDFFDEVDLKKKTITKCKIINHVKYIEEQNQVSIFSIPSIATEVTSYARVKLIKAMLEIGMDNVYYCDTDSILTNSIGDKIIKKKLAGSKIGDLVLEDKSDHVILYALKDYDFGDRSRRKSIPAKAIKKGVSTWEFTQFSTTVQGLKSHEINAMRTKQRRKTLARTYEKGIKNKDGSISPLKLS